MCGIAGLVGNGLLVKSNSVNVSRVEAMLAEVLYRGPDGSNVLAVGNSAIFGMSTLSVIPTTHGIGPFQSHDKIFAITYNGEVYNYSSLGKEWGVDDLNTRCDTEVVLWGYEREGIDFVKKLQGMFAFVIYDGKNNRVILYRDRLGQKPLYYRRSGDVLAFASEIKSILTDGPSTKTVPDEFLAFETPVGNQTMYKDVYILEPGSYVVYDINSGRMCKEYYWRLEKTSESETGNLDRLDMLVREAVADSTPHIPYGLMLSGGLDSSLLAYLMRPEVVFTVRYPGVERFDELEQAKRTARFIGADHIVVEPTAEDLKQHISAIMHHLDHPLGNSSTFSEFMIYKAMKDYGLRIAVGGIGVDELMLGYVRHLLMIEGPHGLDGVLSARYHPLINLYNKKITVDMTTDERYLQLLLRGPLLSQSPAQYLRELFVGKSLGQSLTLVDIGISLPPLLLTADRLSSAFGIEKISPYLDHRLVEFMYWLRDDQKIAEQQTKILFRSVAQRAGLPDEILQSRDKIGFSSPTALFLNGGLSSWYERNVRSVRKYPKIRDLFNQQAERGIFDRTSFQLLCFSVWLNGEAVP